MNELYIIRPDHGLAGGFKCVMLGVCNIMFCSPKPLASSRDKERGPHRGMNEAGKVRLVSSLLSMRVFSVVAKFKLFPSL